LFHPPSLRAALAALTMLLAAAAPAVARDATISGEVYYRQRVALPPGASLVIRVSDLSSNPVVRGETAIERQVPVPFTLTFDADLVGVGQNYAINAEILSRGAVLFRTASPLVVAAGDLSTPLSILVEPAPPPPPVEDTGMPAPALPELFGTVWRLQSLGAVSATPGIATTLSVADDYRAGGSGGCNQYFTQAEIDGNTLHFGLIASTKMLCPPVIDQQERAFFVALAQTAAYRIGDGSLHLLDADGAELARLNH
jgi:putative lipoprotein